MPIKISSNSRVLPANARTGDIARDTINALLPAQGRKAHEAFRVQGYDGVLYHCLHRGAACACKSKTKTAISRLNHEGKADAALLSELMTGEKFGVVPYGADRPKLMAGNKSSTSLSIEDVPSIFDNNVSRPKSSPFDVATTNALDNPVARTVVPEELETGPGVSLDDLFDSVNAEGAGLFGFSDVSCPICFGTGFIGGFSIHNGYRVVFSVSSPAIMFDEGAFLRLDEEIPSAECSSVTVSNVTLPRYAVSVDALRVWAGSHLPNCRILVNGIRLNSEADLLGFCNGRSDNVVTVQFDNVVQFTHLEIQLNQSNDSALIEFPRLQKSSVQSLLENTDPFSINVSPIIPRIDPKDVIVESTYGKALQVKSCNQWNDRTRTILGWDCEVRPVQSNELFNLLPRRHPLQAPRKPAFVRDNSAGARRT